MSFSAEPSPYMRALGNEPLLSRQEEIELAAKIKAGDESARERFIRANLRLVAHIAKGFSYAKVLPYEDLISVGNIGLMTAVDRFDPSKGAKFSTYGALWIKQAIMRAMADQGGEIRLPVHMGDKVRKMRKVAFELRAELGRDPEDEEIAQEMGLSVAQIERLKEASSISTTSIDAPIGEDGQDTFGSIIPDLNTVHAGAEFDQSEQVGIILDCLDKLPERDQEIICRRYGLRGRAAQTLEEVGIHFKLTRERIRQLQVLAEQAIRNLKGKREKSAPLADLRLGKATRDRLYQREYRRKRGVKLDAIGAPTRHGLYRRNIVLTSEQKGQLKLLKQLEYRRNIRRYRTGRRAYYQRNAEYFRQKTRDWIKDNYERYLRQHAEYRKRHRSYLRRKANEYVDELKEHYVRAQLAKKHGRKSGKEFTPEEIEAHRQYLIARRAQRSAMPQCPSCRNPVRKDGFFRPSGKHRYSCRHCKRCYGDEKLIGSSLVPANQ